MRVLGIDPGMALLGWSLLEVPRGQPPRVEFGCIETPANTPLSFRLTLVYDQLKQLMDRYQPNVVAIESLFFMKSAKAIAQVGHTRGVVLLLAGQAKVDVFEYAPRQVKMALTGFGGAEKRQMQLMVQRMLGLKEIPRPDDAADAVAVGLCHLQYSNALRHSTVTI